MLQEPQCGVCCSSTVELRVFHREISVVRGQPVIVVTEIAYVLHRRFRRR